MTPLKNILRMNASEIWPRVTPHTTYSNKILDNLEVCLLNKGLGKTLCDLGTLNQTCWKASNDFLSVLDGNNASPHPLSLHQKSSAQFLNNYILAVKTKDCDAIIENSC